MKHISSVLILLALAGQMAVAQNTKPHYTPSEGVYMVGMPGNLQPVYTEPVMVCQAYSARFSTQGAKLAAINDGSKSVNISTYLDSRQGVLDLSRFMGVGVAGDLLVRTATGTPYGLGDYAPERTWNHTYLVAAYPEWTGRGSYPLSRYDMWDCPITYAPDLQMATGVCHSVTVDFGHPGHGLVARAIDFTLLGDIPSGLTATLQLMSEDGSRVVDYYDYDIADGELSKHNLELTGGKPASTVTLALPDGLVLNQPFRIEVSGFDLPGNAAWLPRAVAPNALYPTHSHYADAAGTITRDATTDVCINLEGYYNYLGAWGWYDGREEYGEVVAAGDYVQVYYSPDDPDYVGDFAGEPSFPVECSFGVQDIKVVDCPDWITNIDTDTSQWDSFGAIQIILSAAPLPPGMTGRLGDVVFSTRDDACQFTIHVRQGTATFTEGLSSATSIVPQGSGISFDLQGRSLTSKNIAKGVYIKEGRKMMR